LENLLDENYPLCVIGCSEIVGTGKITLMNLIPTITRIERNN